MDMFFFFCKLVLKFDSKYLKRGLYPFVEYMYLAKEHVDFWKKKKKHLLWESYAC